MARPQSRRHLGYFSPRSAGKWEPYTGDRR